MSNQLDYILNNFSLFYDIEQINIEYGTFTKTGINIAKECQDFFSQKEEDLNHELIVWKEWKGENIPMLFSKSSDKDIVSYHESGATINYDIIASAFYLLSGWNECYHSKRDRLDRVCYEESIIDKLNISNIPVVNYYFDILAQAIGHTLGKDIKKKPWKDYQFGIALTHDIDTCQRAWLEGSLSELKKGAIFSIPKLIFKRFFKKDDWFNFDTIIETENQFDAKSSFYFLPRKGKYKNASNADYNVKKKSIRKVIKRIKSVGSEVGVHGSFTTHINSDALKNEIKKINTPIYGNRFHYLMFDPQKTVSTLEDCSIEYDTTLGFAERIGFRRSTCFPFYLWNFETNKISSVLEIPLITMDGSLANKKYMGVSKEKALPKVYRCIDQIKKFNGVFTLLWHNTYFSEYKYTGWKSTYIKILEYCKQHNGKLTSAYNISERIKNYENC